jgi:modulator of FtsH protease HflC
MKYLPIAIVVAVLFAISTCTFTVREDQRALVLRLGEIQTPNVQPGLHFKMPFVNEVRWFSARLLSIENPAERYMTGEKKHVNVDSVVKWKIVDTAKFYRAFVQTGSDQTAANIRISQIVKDRLRDEFNKYALRDVVANAREEMMAQIRVTATAALTGYGIEVVDVRIRRIELPDEVSESVFQRMQSERTQIASALIASGQKQAEQLRSAAEKEAKVIIATAESDAQMLRGEGDGKAAEIYAKAYSADPEFYAFYRSLEAYRKSFEGDNNVLVLDPNSEFFKYLEKQ